MRAILSLNHFDKLARLYHVNKPGRNGFSGKVETELRGSWDGETVDGTPGIIRGMGLDREPELSEDEHLTKTSMGGGSLSVDYVGSNVTIGTDVILAVGLGAYQEKRCPACEERPM